ncbi:MAG: hypothetical protein DMD54_17995 [Gemmatimonadetes bacterium]|nr:MAG: hypothetical protein DMD54_17995 [Gemmatimonadota bacterium]
MARQKFRDINSDFSGITQDLLSHKIRIEPQEVRPLLFANGRLRKDLRIHKPKGPGMGLTVHAIWFDDDKIAAQVYML